MNDIGRRIIEEKKRSLHKYRLVAQLPFDIDAYVGEKACFMVNKRGNIEISFDCRQTDKIKSIEKVLPPGQMVLPFEKTEEEKKLSFFEQKKI